MALKHTRVEVSNAVFSLPYYCARDEGYFAAEGLEVELVPAGSGRNRDHDAALKPIEDHKMVDSYGWHKGIEQDEVCLYRACEWGQIRRTQDSRAGAKVVSKRAAVSVQAIVVRGDSPYNIPADLKNVPVAVNFHAGSHYQTLGLLGGFLNRDEIKPVHVGGPKQRFDALKNGTVGAAAVMEPWVTVAEKLGYKVIAESFYEGAEVATPALDPDGYAAIDRAIKRAVKTLNADVRPYLKYMIAEVPERVCRLAPEDFHLSRLRYNDPRPYTEAEYRQIYDWMVSWGLLSADSVYERIVEHRARA